MKLNLGCGNKILPGYINVDVKQRGGKQPDIEADIRYLPQFDETVDEILAVHVIEHFYPWEADDLLTEWKRVLKPGGKLILECPDFVKACWYVMEAVSNQKPMNMQLTMWPLYGDDSYKDELMMHKYGYTPMSLGKKLHELGFVKIEEKPAQYKMKEVRDMRLECFKPGESNEV